MSQQRSQLGSAGVRVGEALSKSLRNARLVSSPEELSEKPGETLVTTNHEVIQRWAEQRDAVPATATATGTEHDDGLGVLTFDFPPVGNSDRLRHVTWDQWFTTFDRRGLNFIFQEKLRNGRSSNFLRLENPEREGA